MWKLLRRYLKNYVGWIIGAFLLITAQTATQMILLMGEMKRILDEGVTGGNMSVIYASGLRMLLYTLLIGAITIGVAYLTSKVSGILVCHVRQDCYEKILNFSPADFDRFGEATLLTRTTDDPKNVVALVQLFISRAVMMPVVIVCILVMVYRNSRSSFFILTVALLLSGIVMAALEIKSKPLFEGLQRRIDHLNLLIREKITGVREIRAFGNEQQEEEKGIGADQEIYKAAIAANRPMKFLNPATLVIINWAVVLIYYVGTREIRAGLTGISSLILIFQYLSYFLMALSLIPALVNLLPKAQVSGRRILELLDYESEAHEIQQRENTDEVKANGENGAVKEPADGSIEFRNVSFRYDGGRLAVENLSFRVESGEKLAIIGATGSGKSTLLKLMMGFYPAGEGEILIGGVPISSIDREKLTEQCSYASQKAYVFKDTVQENITAFREDCSEERIGKAVRGACFDEVLAKLPEGTGTEMSQGGMNLSGGERKRLSLARSLAKDAKIYLLDDPYAALDAVTEAKARERVNGLLKDRTVVTVSSKIASIADADKILVLENGHMAAIGRHEQLLKECREYRELYDTQCYLNREEP